LPRQLGETGEHRCDASEERDDLADLVGGCELQEGGGLECSGSFCSLPSGASKPCQAVIASTARGFGDAEVRRQERPAELVAKLGVATRKPAGEPVTAYQCFTANSEGVELVMLKGTGLPGAGRLG